MTAHALGKGVAVGDATIFTKWQSLPITFIAMAWIDDRFRQEFIHSPTAVIQSAAADYPHGVTFCALENTSSLHHYVLPYQEPETYSWTEEQLLAQMRKEISYENMEYMLPLEVIARAFTDYAFRQELVLYPKKILASMGYRLEDKEYFIHENTETTYHLVIPENKWLGEDVGRDEVEDFIEAMLEKVTYH